MWWEHGCPHTPFSALSLTSVSFLPLSLSQEGDKFILHPQEEARVAHLLGSTLCEERSLPLSLKPHEGVSRRAGGDCKQAGYSWCPWRKLSNWREIRSSERNMVCGDTLRTTGSSWLFFLFFFFFLDQVLPEGNLLLVTLVMQTINNKFRVSSVKSDGASFSDLLLFSPSVMFDFLQTHGLQHPRLPCPSLSPGACSNLHQPVELVMQPNHLILCHPELTYLWGVFFVCFLFFIFIF